MVFVKKMSNDKVWSKFIIKIVNKLLKSYQMTSFNTNLKNSLTLALISSMFLLLAVISCNKDDTNIMTPPNNSWQANQISVLPQIDKAWEPAMASGPNGKLYVLAGSLEGEFVRKPYLWISNDNGTTWNDPFLLPNSLEEEGDPRMEIANDGTIFISMFSGDPNTFETNLLLYKSTDDGQTFERKVVYTGTMGIQGDNALTFDKPELAISLDGSQVYISFVALLEGNVDFQTETVDRFDTFLIKSIDGGETFGDVTLVSNSMTNTFYATSSSAILDNGTYIVGTIKANGQDRIDTEYLLYYSRDGGTSFEETVLVDNFDRERPIGDLVFTANNNQLIGTYILDENGASTLTYFEGYQSGSITKNDLITNSSLELNFPSVAANGNGEAMISWADKRSGNFKTFARVKENSGDFSREIELYDFIENEPRKTLSGYINFFGDYTEIVSDADGNFHLIWPEADGDRGSFTEAKLSYTKISKTEN